jgi:hypothetical protein
MQITPLVNLDFDQIKLYLKYFLKNNTKFTDYDYTGSNINQLLDVLSYTTFLNAYNLNLGLNELNLETAVLRDSVQMKAQELGYIPRNYNSATIDISLKVALPPTTKFIEIPIGVLLIGTNTNTNRSHRFNVLDRKIVTNKSGFATIDLALTEGLLLEQRFEYGVDEDDRIIIKNDKIDINSIRVRVNDNVFIKSENILTNQKNVFYTTIIQDNNIEIEFGKNIFGTEPSVGDIIKVSYVVNNGSEGNDMGNFTFTGELKSYTENNTIGVVVPLSNINYTTLGTSYGGTDVENLKTIKFNATKRYLAQDRAVVGGDYQTIILQNFSNIGYVSVIGGEDLVPPQYGKVKLIIQTKNATKLGNVQKNNITKKLKQYNITTIPIIEDAIYAKLKITPYIKYDLNKLPISIDELSNRITKIINDYIISNDFSKNFYGNKLESLIYAADKSIVSVQIKLVLINDILPNANGNYTGSLNTKIKSDNCKLFSFATSSYLIDGSYYRLVSLGDSGVIDQQKYTNDTNTSNWQNDSVVGQFYSNTGGYNYTVNGISDDLTSIIIPNGLDINTDNNIIQPIVNTPVISATEPVINYDILSEPELKDPTPPKNNITVDTVVLNDIIPVVSSIVC